MRKDLKFFIGLFSGSFIFGNLIQEIRKAKLLKSIKEHESERDRLIAERDELLKSCNELSKERDNYVDPHTKWNDYSKHGDCSLYLWNGCELYVATQDDINISEEDEAEGYKDSWVIDIYSLADVNYYGSESVPQGGQWLETNYISELDCTLEEIMKRLYTCDLWPSDWKILNSSKGEMLRKYFEGDVDARNTWKNCRRLLENYLASNNLV